jgi:hypothetical protein
MADKLTDKQRLFIYEYLKDFNASRAAQAAGYSEKTAYSIGSENLKKPEIREAMQEYIDNDLGVSEKIIIENIRFWQNMRDDPEAPEQARLKASEHLSRYNGMFVEKQDIHHTGEISVIKWGEVMGGDGPETEPN